jgi:hypothetical protein
MRSFVALMACIGCIAWVHSCEKRLLGVRLEKNNISDPVQQVPLAINPMVVTPVDDISLITATNTITLPKVATIHTKGRSLSKKESNHTAKESVMFDVAVVRGQYSLLNSLTP